MNARKRIGAEQMSETKVVDLSKWIKNITPAKKVEQLDALTTNTISKDIDLSKWGIKPTTKNDYEPKSMELVLGPVKEPKNHGSQKVFTGMKFIGGAMGTWKNHGPFPAYVDAPKRGEQVTGTGKPKGPAH